MNDLHDSIRDALSVDADRAPEAPTMWVGPTATVDTSSDRRPYAWLAVAATAVLVVAGLWVITRRDTGDSSEPANSTAAGGLDFSGTHRAAMEAEFPPDAGATMVESMIAGSRSSAYDLEATYGPSSARSHPSTPPHTATTLPHLPAPRTASPWTPTSPR